MYVLSFKQHNMMKEIKKVKQEGAMDKKVMLRSKLNEMKEKNDLIQREKDILKEENDVLKTKEQEWKTRENDLNSKLQVTLSENKILKRILQNKRVDRISSNPWRWNSRVKRLSRPPSAVSQLSRHYETFLDFLTQYVLNCPVFTEIELLGRNRNDGIVEVEFIRIPSGFVFNRDFERDFDKYGRVFLSKYVTKENEGILTPDVWLDMVITPFIRQFSILKMHTPQMSIHIWTSQTENVRLCSPEHFSTVAYLEMKRTRNPRSEGRTIFRSLMDLPPLCDLVETSNNIQVKSDAFMSSDNIQENNSSEDNKASGNMSSDIASNNMDDSSDNVASDNMPLDNSSDNRLLDNIASNNMQLDKMASNDLSSDNISQIIYRCL
ncbi:uncharacterized protein TNIN_350071 [Trichonephila inaurata madagascariensis]|uniref:Uncharacterized protein n=1 Tax=Trichonephila inaurata madagascariensis TaxID=2747483 RepID=A0A8X6IMW1_9ARAC|nr:uncharacterized protein TNIN_350071 [Trichonephila inaurata madagascariensis]